MEEMSKEELLKLIRSYNNYIIDICEDEQNIMNKYPVYINEFIDCEFKKGIYE